MFQKGRVKFLWPSEEEGDWFNVLVLHQNRSEGGRRVLLPTSAICHLWSLWFFLLRMHIRMVYSHFVNSHFVNSHLVISSPPFPPSPYYPFVLLLPHPVPPSSPLLLVLFLYTSPTSTNSGQSMVPPTVF